MLNRYLEEHIAIAIKTKKLLPLIEKEINLCIKSLKMEK